MHRSLTRTITKLSAVVLVSALGFVGAETGASLAQTRSAATGPLPCQLGGPQCDHIGFTEGWFAGRTVDFEYSHEPFCAMPPASGAASKCEVGADAQTAPPSGPVVSSIYAIVPMGFTPPASTLQCPQAGRCVDFPKTVDLTAIGGAADAAFPAHSNIIEDFEAYQSTWWPLVVVGVKSLSAWNQLATQRSASAMDACETAGNCTAEMPTNAFIFFQVLGPGMSPTGPA